MKLLKFAWLNMAVKLQAISSCKLFHATNLKYLLHRTYITNQFVFGSEIKQLRLYTEKIENEEEIYVHFD